MWDSGCGRVVEVGEVVPGSVVLVVVVPGSVVLVVVTWWIVETAKGARWYRGWLEKGERWGHFVEECRLQGQDGSREQLSRTSYSTLDARTQ